MREDQYQIQKGIYCTISFYKSQKLRNYTIVREVPGVITFFSALGNVLEFSVLSVRFDFGLGSAYIDVFTL